MNKSIEKNANSDSSDNNPDNNLPRSTKLFIPKLFYRLG